MIVEQEDLQANVLQKEKNEKVVISLKIYEFHSNFGKITIIDNSYLATEIT